MRGKRRSRYLSLVSILVLLVTTLMPVSPAFAAITWNTKAPMPTARDHLGVGVVNGKIYAIGGRDVTGGPLATGERYDPATNSWAAVASMPTARSRLDVGVVNGRIYAIGGRDVVGSVLATVEEYDPVTNTWTTLAPMPTARRKPAAGVANGQIYVIGGRDASGSLLATVERYDLATNSWAAVASMSTARSHLAAGVVNGKIYAIGGEDGTSFIATVERYDPVANTWTVETPMPTARTHLAAGVVDNKIYAIGGRAPGGVVLATNEEGIVPVQSEDTVQVQATVDPTIELVLNPTTLNFGNVNPSVGNYSQTKTATVKSNKDWQLLVRKVSDLTGANTGWVIPSSQLTFTSPAQTDAQFQTTDTLVNSGGKTAGTLTTITYNLTVTWLDSPDSYSAEHIYTAIQP